MLLLKNIGPITDLLPHSPTQPLRFSRDELIFDHVIDIYDFGSIFIVGMYSIHVITSLTNISGPKKYTLEYTTSIQIKSSFPIENH